MEYIKEKEYFTVVVNDNLYLCYSDEMRSRRNFFAFTTDERGAIKLKNYETALEYNKYIKGKIIKLTEKIITEKSEVK